MIEGRVTYRRPIKHNINAKEQVPKVLGVYFWTYWGAEMARKEEFKEGQIPLHTFRADIDYALGEAQTVYGKLGIKVWVCRGMMYHKPDFYGLETTNNKRNNPTNRSRRSPRRKK